MHKEKKNNMKKDNEFSQDNNWTLEDFGALDDLEDVQDVNKDEELQEESQEDIREEKEFPDSESEEEIYPETNEGKQSKRSVAKEAASWILTFAIAIAVALILRNYVLINANVPTGSMENTIVTGADMFGYRLAYLNSDPERGDIIIFRFPDNEKEKYVKRIIGLPGETVTINEGKIYINDATEPLEEEYLKEDWVEAAGPYVFQVPENSYFVMGDNRNNSYDSRYWDNTFVTREEIIGKALFVYYPFNHMGTLN